MSTELTPDELLALADDHYVGWEEDAREALRDAALNAKLLRNRAIPAEPPSIVDMAPGTTFVEAVPWTVVDADAVHDHSAGLRYRGLHTFDPSTIRDVTPPPATPEEGDVYQPDTHAIADSDMDPEEGDRG